VITLILLHPLQPTPAQHWTFGDEPIIRIGRATDNHVVLYSAVVSRRHVELRRLDDGWEIVNLGANGTYLDGERITQVPVVDGVIIRLARSGPQIQIRFGATALKEASKTTSQKRSPTSLAPEKANESYFPPKVTDIEVDYITEPDDWLIPSQVRPGDTGEMRLA
jgi:pSer/pThr/pTyr-binding forkhead associated (FHA) protein